jgi:signal-transduction protein with cAMP-binding, CBS, and nucleotidyltransferase domain
MTIRDIARRDVVSVSPETGAERIAEVLRDERVGSAVVVEADDPVGIVTDRDLGIGVWDHADPAAATATDLMTADPVTVDIDEGIYDALQVAREADVRRLPVVEDGRLAGIVTLDDFVVLLSGELEVVSDVVQAESPSY